MKNDMGRGQTMGYWNHIRSANFHSLNLTLGQVFIEQSHRVTTERWQGVELKGRPEAMTHELLNVGFTIDLMGIEALPHWQFDIKPNLPWADAHFEERVCGAPINPGTTWKTWPWGGNAEKFLDSVGMFNHNYMERYWPKFAGRARGPSKVPDDLEYSDGAMFQGAIRGIRGPYGDLKSLVQLLVNEPLTRQAWLPIFFPEDTGDANPGRKPCTLGYQFIMRDDRLHVYYPLRSCDFAKHFNDDVYLTLRLLLWVLDQCRKIDPDTWLPIGVGSFTMHATSLHLFANDMIDLKKRYGVL